ncbi:MAG: LEA type 2 family protein [Bacteroidales bacterium]|nr:LEA type 2 family protein [Bacteroidales bacterium]
MIFFKTETYNMIKKIALLLIPLLFSSCVTIKEVNVGKIQGLKVEEVTKESVKLEFQIPIENKNNFKIKIKDVDLKIDVNRVSLGEVKKIKKIVIPANSNEIHNFHIEAKVSNLLMGSLAMIGSMLGGKANVKVNGHIKAKAFFVTKKIKIEENNPVKLFNKKKDH